MLTNLIETPSQRSPTRLGAHSLLFSPLGVNDKANMPLVEGNAWCGQEDPLLCSSISKTVSSVDYNHEAPCQCLLTRLGAHSLLFSPLGVNENANMPLLVEWPAWHGQEDPLLCSSIGETMSSVD